MRSLILVLGLMLAHTHANAWFFFFIPGTGGAPDTFCVTNYAKIGDRVTIPNRGSGAVTALEGTSWRCRDERYPIKASIDFNAPVTVAAQSAPVISNFQPTPPPAPPMPTPVSAGPNTYTADKCAPADAKAGGMHFDDHLGHGTIEQVVGASLMCMDPPYPQRVVVRFKGPAAAEKPAETPTPAAAKLRELAGMLKDGLITQEDFDAKKAEILKAL